MRTALFGKHAALITCLLFFLAFQCASAESLGTVTLGSSIDRAVKKWGKPSSTKTLRGGKKKYSWNAGKARITATTANGSIVFLRASADIGVSSENRSLGTAKGVFLGGKDERIVPKYGKGRDDYAYPSEDCYVLNYKTAPKEMLVFRIYGFNKRGAVIIDIVLCRPEYAGKDMFVE